MTTWIILGVLAFLAASVLETLAVLALYRIVRRRDDAETARQEKAVSDGAEDWLRRRTR